MYCRLDVDDMDSVELASDKGEPNSDMEASSAQCTTDFFFGVAAIPEARRLVVLDISSD